MKTLKIGRHKVEVYNSIDEMPVSRYHLLSKLLLVDSGVGATVGDVDAHLAKAIEYLKAGVTSSAVQELENLRQSVYMIEKGVDPKSKAFAALVARIDGEDVGDLSDEGLDETVSKLDGLTYGELLRTVEGAKKKYGGGA